MCKSATENTVIGDRGVVIDDVTERAANCQPPIKQRNISYNFHKNI